MNLKEYTMKTTFEATDLMEIKRIAKSEDMALFIWHLVHGKLQKDGEGCDQFLDCVNTLLDDYNIDIDELID